MASRITRDDVQHVARLARLVLTDDEVERFTEQLGVILEYAQDMAELQIDDVEPTAHPVPVENVLRPDEVHRGLDREEVLSQAPAAEDGRFRVPRILDTA